MITVSTSHGRKSRRVCALGRYLVVLRRRHHEENGRDPVEALEPLLPLRPLPPHVHHLEGDLLDDKVVLDDALCRLPGKQNVLFARDVVLERGGKQRLRRGGKELRLQLT